jgi:hypothetical protein
MLMHLHLFFWDPLLVIMCKLGTCWFDSDTSMSGRVHLCSRRVVVKMAWRLVTMMSHGQFL